VSDYSLVPVHNGSKFILGLIICRPKQKQFLVFGLEEKIYSSEAEAKVELGHYISSNITWMKLED
jgi:hypothetical protein